MSDVCKLAIKIERQLKVSKGNRYETRDSYTRGGPSKPTLQSNMTSKTQGKDETFSGNKQPKGNSILSGLRCFKYQGLGHIASDYPK